MTSRVNGLYVWIQIHGIPVIAGRFDLSDKIGTFYYANSYINNPNAFALDPINLPLIPEQEFVTQANGGVFGAFLDAGPDQWGQRVLSILSLSKPRSALEYLLAGNGEGCGAIMFSLSRSAIKEPKLRHSPGTLTAIEIGVNAIINDETISPQIKEVLEHSSAFGGARPKATIEQPDGRYLAKFNKKSDLINNARAEQATMEMAKAVGIDTIEINVVHNPNTGRDVLLTKLFDYDQEGHKKHYLSAHSILNLHKIRENDPDAGYPGLATIMRKFIHDPIGSTKQLYKRMVFRTLIGDTDDHARNHGFLRDNKSGLYSLSPMFDSLPHPTNIGQQAMTIGRYGRASSLANLISLSDAFGIDKANAAKIIKEQKNALKQWRSFYVNAGMTQLEISIIEPCLSLISEKSANLDYES